MPLTYTRIKNEPYVSNHNVINETADFFKEAKGAL
jgi:hypothetical protein